MPKEIQMSETGLKHPVEIQFSDFLRKVEQDGGVDYDPSDLEYFLKRCEETFKKYFDPERRNQVSRGGNFTLRFSNIGRTTRSLYLEKEYGRIETSPPEFIRNMTGDLIEDLVAAIFRMSDVEVVRESHYAQLDMGDGVIIKGETDFTVRNPVTKMPEVIDVKSASKWSYDNKFKSFYSLAEDDSFGYLTQGFAYAQAESNEFNEKVFFGGNLVVNKNSGEFRIVGPTLYEHDAYQKQALNHMKVNIQFFNDPNAEPPPCPGVIEETHYRKPTGNKILDAKCGLFCDYKYKCHPELQCIPSVRSKGQAKNYEYYVELNNKMEDKDNDE